MTYSGLPKGLNYNVQGGRGSDFHLTSNVAYFVESRRGSLSSHSLLRNLQSTPFSGVVSSLTPNISLNLLDGTKSASGGNIRLDYNTPNSDGFLNLRPIGDCKFNLLGAVSFSTINHASLQNAIYANTRILYFNSIYIFISHDYLWISLLACFNLDLFSLFTIVPSSQVSSITPKSWYLNYHFLMNSKITIM